MNESHKRIKTITIRHPSPSRGGQYVIVAQLQDAAGRWMVPTITCSESIQQMIESGRYARDVGVALLVANYWFEQWTMDIETRE